MPDSQRNKKSWTKIKTSTQSYEVRTEDLPVPIKRPFKKYVLNFWDFLDPSLPPCVNLCYIRINFDLKHFSCLLDMHKR